MQEVRRGARARVLDQLRDAIIKGEYPPGSALSEGTLAETYGTSRTPIREAIQQLQSEGLVEVVPRVGTFVREPSRRELGELFELKSVLEGLGANLLARRGRVAETELLEANVEESRLAVARGDVERYAKLVHDFHGLLIQGADSRKLADHYQILMNQLAYHRIVVSTLRHPGRLGASLNEHHLVLERILEKDGFGAEAAMRDHVRSSQREAMTD
ncbi:MULTISPECIES: GntR family transcriptional regulator [Amycolatopsis]|uniref:GntR family transcriptional regulator n=1 Tax=Amycolatopsis thermalba TaxID=944492 RepID=A0ABY4NWR5_9PSEU|nr:MULTISPECIES: GntR family transcriptional regulator [Amycolatopsis]OXM64295.1 GntR family transcriptional regulator [Amycolatopsis sp. KNN50.9b]UQS24495.1 GntR family transcriptional regulator [Amycolatopsis thermalba]